ncbi:MAG: hypothetical protein ACOYMN_25245 [Roseimicrobium sp.]
MLIASFVARWGVKRLTEFTVFCLVAAIAWTASQGDQLETAIRAIAWSAFAYGVVLLYLPLSALVWVVAAPRLPKQRLPWLDAVVFIVHGYAAMSIMNNGVWILQRPINWQNPLIVGWFGALSLHVVFLGASVVFRHKEMNR